MKNEVLKKIRLATAMSKAVPVFPRAFFPNDAIHLLRLTKGRFWAGERNFKVKGDHMAKLEEMQTIYTKYPSTAFFSEPKIGGRVIARLDNRSSLMWLAGGFSDKGMKFHKVSFRGKVGYIPETGLTLEPENRLGEEVWNCKTCNGSGHMSMPQGWEAYAGQALFRQCDACKGTGKASPTMSARAYASHGVGTKG